MTEKNNKAVNNTDTNNKAVNKADANNTSVNNTSVNNTSVNNTSVNNTSVNNLNKTNVTTGPGHVKPSVVPIEKSNNRKTMSIRAGSFHIVFKGQVDGAILELKTRFIQEQLTRTINNRAQVTNFVTFVQYTDKSENADTILRVYFMFSKSISVRPVSTFYHPYINQLEPPYSGNLSSEGGIVFFLKEFEVFRANPADNLESLAETLAYFADKVYVGNTSSAEDKTLNHPKKIDVFYGLFKK